MLPQVSVIVVARNEERTISGCLQSLTTQDFPKDNYEIIVVDGQSSDGTPDICQKYPVKLVQLARAGISLQRNTGVEMAQGRYIAFTDADCIAESKWLQRLTSQITDNDKGVIAVGGPNLVFDGDSPLSRVIGYAQETFLGSGGSAQSHRITKPRYVNSIPNCNILYKREAFTEEQYDNNLGVGDDCDLNFRLKQRGYRFLYLPEIVVWHHRPRTFQAFLRKIFSYGEAMGKLTRKYRRVVRWYAIAAAIAIAAVLFSYPLIRYFHPAVYVYASAAFLYLVALAVSTFQVLTKYRTKQSLMTLILLPLQHFIYGLGFMKGVIWR